MSNKCILCDKQSEIHIDVSKSNDPSIAALFNRYCNEHHREFCVDINAGLNATN